MLLPPPPPRLLLPLTNTPAPLRLHTTFASASVTTTTTTTRTTARITIRYYHYYYYYSYYYYYYSDGYCYLHLVDSTALLLLSQFIVAAHKHCSKMCINSNEVDNNRSNLDAGCSCCCCWADLTRGLRQPSVDIQLEVARRALATVLVARSCEVVMQDGRSKLQLRTNNSSCFHCLGH